MIKQFCDRCGCELASAGRFAGASGAMLDRIAVRVVRYSREQQRTDIDLCTDCSLELDRWLRMEVIP